MRQARPETADRLQFVVVGDLSTSGGFDDIVIGVDGIIHCAAVRVLTVLHLLLAHRLQQPVQIKVNDGEKDVMLPIMKGMKAILTAASTEPRVKRVVVTSSYAAMADPRHNSDPKWMYTAEHWNPLTYDEAKGYCDHRAYSGAKKFSELYAWQYMREVKPHFDLVTIVPPIVLGPVVHPVVKVSELNLTNLALGAIATGQEYPPEFAPVWADVRDVAIAHAEALMRPDAGGRRLIVCAPEKLSHQRVADIMRQEFGWARDVVKKGDEGAAIPPSFTMDSVTARKVLGVSYRSLRECIVDFTAQVRELALRE